MSNGGIWHKIGSKEIQFYWCFLAFDVVAMLYKTSLLTYIDLKFKSFASFKSIMP